MRRSASVTRLERERDDLTAGIEQAEGALGEIDETFASPGFFERTPPEAVKEMQQRRAELQASVERMMVEWERVEREIEAGTQPALR